MNQRLSYDGADAYQNFINSLKSPNTRRTYQKGLSLYLSTRVLKYNQLLKDDNNLLDICVKNLVAMPLSNIVDEPIRLLHQELVSYKDNLDKSRYLFMVGMQKLKKELLELLVENREELTQLEKSSHHRGIQKS